RRPGWGTWSGFPRSIGAGCSRPFLPRTAGLPSMPMAWAIMASLHPTEPPRMNQAASLPYARIALGSGGVRFPGWTHVDFDPAWEPEVVARSEEHTSEL